MGSGTAAPEERKHPTQRRRTSDMRIRPVWLYVFSLLFIAGFAGCSKSETPKSAPTTATPAVESQAKPGSPGSEALVRGEALFQQKCSQCHDLKRANSRFETKEKWAEIVKQMQKKPGSGISDVEAEQILGYLVAKHRLTSKGEALFEEKCSQCHGLERATSRTETREKWAEIVKQMQKKPASGISDAEAEKILDYLVTEHKTATQF
jgi:mono/diheme cytochrome c family protein